METEATGKAEQHGAAQGPFYVIVPLLQATSGLCLILGAAAFPFLVDLSFGAGAALGGVLSVFAGLMVLLSALMGLVLCYAAYCLAAKRERALELAFRAQHGYMMLHIAAVSLAFGSGSTRVSSAFASLALAAGLLWWIHRRKARAEDQGMPVDGHGPPLAGTFST